MVRNWLENIQPVVILRFLGTSPDSSNIAPLLTTVCQQVRTEMGTSADDLLELCKNDHHTCILFLTIQQNFQNIQFWSNNSFSIQIAWNYDESQLNCAPTELSKLFHYFKKITGD